MNLRSFFFSFPSLLPRRIYKGQLVHLITILSNKAHNSPARGRIVGSTIASRRSGAQCPPRARGGLDVKVACVIIILALAQLRTRPILPARERQARRRAARATVCECSAVAQRYTDTVESIGAAESDGRHSRFVNAVEGLDIAEPGPVRASPEAALLQLRTGRPREININRVVVRQGGAGRGQEPCAHVLETAGVERHERRGPVKELVDGLAGGVTVGLRVIAQGLHGGYNAGARILHPCICEVGVQQCANGRVCGARVAAVGVAKDKYCVTNGPSLGVGQDLVDVAVASDLIGVRGACIGMQVVNVNEDGCIIICGAGHL